MKNTNKYWENETPVETTTENMEFRYFPEAGKFQMYGRYESDGEMRRTKAIVLDTGDIKMSEAQAIVKAMMECLFDVVISDSTMSSIVKMVTAEPARAGAEEVSEEELSEVLDEEFEDENPMVSEIVTKVLDRFGGDLSSVSEEELDKVLDEVVDEVFAYFEMSFKELKSECDKRGIGYKKIGESKAHLIALLRAADKLEVLVTEQMKAAMAKEPEPSDNYDAMSVKELRAECKSRDIKVSGKPSKEWLIDTLREDDKVRAEYADTDDQDDDTYDGKWLTYTDGDVLASHKTRKVDKATAAEWLDYFNENMAEIEAMVKKATNKKTKAVDADKLEKLMVKWVPEFEADEDTTTMLSDFVKHFCKDIRDGNGSDMLPERKREFCMIIDQM